MRSRFPHGGEVLGAAPANPILAPVLSQDRALSMSRQRDLLDLQAIQRIPGFVGYWKADPQYLFEDSAGTTPASLGGVIGNWTSLSSPALQATTANKPILRKTPTSGVYWADSNTATSALNVALGNLGSACTVARSSAEGVTFTENVSITSTYNLAPAFAFNSDVALFNRALTDVEKALITRYMQRAVPMLGNNLCRNSTFDVASNWTLSTFSIADGVATKSATGATGFIRQSVGVVGKQYLSKFSLVAWSAGSIGHFNGASQFGTYVSPANYVGVYVCGGANAGVSTNTSFLGSVDDVYLQEIL